MPVCLWVLDSVLRPHLGLLPIELKFIDIYFTQIFISYIGEHTQPLSIMTKCRLMLVISISFNWKDHEKCNILYFVCNIQNFLFVQQVVYIRYHYASEWLTFHVCRLTFILLMWRIG